MDLVGDADSRVLTACPGGSPANVAVGLARLGVPTSLFARLGPDRFGRELRAHLADNGVSDRDLTDAAEPTSLAVATVAADGAARYDFWVTGTADWQWRPGELPARLPDDVVALHAGSLASWTPPGADEIEALTRRERGRGRVTLCFDPNCRPALIPDRDAHRKLVERQVALAHVVKVSEEDLAWLCPGEPYADVAERWQALGPELVVVTRGGDGAYGRCRAGVAAVPARTVAVVDTVGAGDAFTAGLLAGLRDRDLLGPARAERIGALARPALAALLAEASLVAALTAARPGADPPTRNEVAAALAAG